MQIKLKKLTLQNFKGQRHLDIDFSDVTNIYGRNGTGKTTLLDAFLWGLFGKDSTYRSTFEIKTLDEYNNPYRRLQHEVTIVLLVDEQEITLKKLYEEKWVRKTGAKEDTFSGHTTSFWWNEVPLKESEYSAKVASIINEQQFMLLTNLAYFNTVLKWEDRRKALLSIAGDIKDLDVANQYNDNGQYDHLIAALSNKTLDEYKKELAGKVRKIKEDSDNLPARISEARRALPEELDYTFLEKTFAERQKDLAGVEAKLLNKTEAQKERQQHISGLMTKQNELRRTLITLESNARNTVKDKAQQRTDNIAQLRRELRTLQDERNSLLSKHEAVKDKNKYLIADKVRLEAEKELVGKLWDELNAQVFKMNPDECVCPACKQSLPNALEKENELKENFNKNKTEKLARLTDKGVSIKNEIEARAKEIVSAEAEMENIKAGGQVKAAEISEKEKSIAVFEEENNRLAGAEEQEVANYITTNKEILSVKEQINNLEAEISAPIEEDGNDSQLLAQKTALGTEISELQRKLAGKEQKERIEARITELESTEEKSAQELSTLEGLQFSLLEFDKRKMDVLEERINGRFRLVKFKLFDSTIDGSHKPACVALVNGVPYTDANTASKINASLDIINVFSDYYNVKAPVFIDNRESVTDIIHTDMQVINLVVSPEDTKLRIEAREAEAAFT